ncbi:hypothetical protein ACFQO7_34915 [Catellatospora aurea]|uniref:Uncharacterized protein n=1 Tax=Catellatospora aurea TaxID=1337874 RepID=A0ABW2H603_9ACTN
MAGAYTLARTLAEHRDHPGARLVTGWQRLRLGRADRSAPHAHGRFGLGLETAGAGEDL